jgi:ribose 5-phosphate isomerase B
MARMARAHNDANILALGARVVGEELAWSIVQTWLTTPFSGDERHRRRLAKIAALETGRAKGAGEK